jgi:hypothetical protein
MKRCTGVVSPAAKIAKKMALVLLAIAPVVYFADAEQVPVRFQEGTTHGFLVLRSLGGKELATGDLTETAHGDRVSTQLTFNFKDGSNYDEVTTFSQTGTFRLLNYHLTEKGPSFQNTMDVTMDTTKGEVTVRYQEKDGQEKVINKHMDIPSDVANGMIPFLLKNIPATSAGTTVSMMATTPKPQVVKLIITPDGTEPFTSGGVKRETTRYLIKVHVDGLTGVAAKVTGRLPPDSYAWMLQSKVPTFLSAQQFLVGGPMCRIELTTPQPPQNVSQNRRDNPMGNTAAADDKGAAQSEDGVAVDAAPAQSLLMKSN